MQLSILVSYQSMSPNSLNHNYFRLGKHDSNLIKNPSNNVFLFSYSKIHAGLGEKQIQSSSKLNCNIPACNDGKCLCFFYRTKKFRIKIKQNYLCNTSSI